MLGFKRLNEVDGKHESLMCHRPTYPKKFWIRIWRKGENDSPMQGDFGGDIRKSEISHRRKLHHMS